MLLAESQEALALWGHLIISTGGNLKLENGFYYLVDYEWHRDGSCSYVSMVDNGGFSVPQLDGLEVVVM